MELQIHSLLLKDNIGMLTCFCFHSMNNDPLFSRFYFENIHILEHFSQYFELKAKNLINQYDDRVLASFHQNLIFLANQRKQTLIKIKYINSYLKPSFHILP